MAIFKTAQLEVRQVHNTDLMASSKPMEALLLGSEAAKADEQIKQRFVKFAQHLKRVAPKAKDFLYFSCIMMHAAEAALIDQNTGLPVKNGEDEVTSEWKIDNKGSWKWACSDPNIKPYKNNNGDIFPEVELKKAYRKWIGRPLCKDHQSGSVDGIRGIIVDTYYDDKRKRVIALCALDKINYPDLARKVSTGYATNVSMGTAVGISICFECGNIARVEADYCPCVKTKKTYGEINIDLSPIELSLVVTGADPQAKLRNVIASLEKYSNEKGERIKELKRAGCVTPDELTRLENEIVDLRNTVRAATNLMFYKAAAVGPGAENIEQARNLGEVLKHLTSPEARKKVENIITSLLEEVPAEEPVEVEPASATPSTKDMGDTEKGYTGSNSDTGPPEWSPERTDIMRMTSDKTADLGIQINAINKKLDAMELALRDMATGVQEVTTHKEEQSMSDKELRQRAAARRAMFQKSAYHQGGGDLNDPANLPYPVDPLNDQLKTKGDKQMEGQGMEPGNDGLHPGYDSFGQSEESLKKMLSRAELEERKMRRHAFMKQAEEPAQELETKKTPSGATVAKTPDGKVIMLNNDGTYNEVDDTQIQQARDLVKMVGRGTPSPTKKEAYWQGGGGVNEPQTYPVDPMNDKLKTDGDKQMEGQGMEPGNDGLHPGYQSYGNEEALKKKLLRAQLRAKFIVAYKNEDKTVIDKKNSRWEIYAGPDKILEATGAEIYEDELEQNWELLASKEWGRKAIAAIREKGFERVAWLLKGESLEKTAQPPMPPPTAGGEKPMPPPPAVEGLPEAAPEEEAKDPVQSALDTLSESLESAEKAMGDLKDALEEVTGKSEGAELPDVGGAEADDAEQLAMAEVASQIKEVYSGLDESADELAMLAESLESRFKAGKGSEDAVTAELLRLAPEAVNESAELRREASLVIDAAKKKEKKEEEEDEKEEKEDDKKDKKGKGKLPPALEKAIEKKKEKKEKKEDKKEDKEEKEDEEEKGEKKEKNNNGKKSKAEVLLENLLKARAAKRRELVREADEEVAESYAAEGMTKADVEKIVKDLLDEMGVTSEFMKEEMEEPEHAPEEEALVVEEPAGELETLMEGSPEASDGLELELSQMLDDLNALEDQAVEQEADSVPVPVGDLTVDAEARKAWRERVAAEVGAKYQLSLDQAVTVDSDMPAKFHPQGGHDLERLDISPSDQGAYFETIVEQHDKIMKEVQNLPKVREAMEHLGGLLKNGTLTIDDLDDVKKLKALAVDPEAAKYWKTYFGEGDAESKKFGNELTQEYTKKKSEANLDEQRVKLSRAYDIALDMQEKGMIADDRATLEKQVNEIMSFDNKSFESFKRALSRVAKPAQVKTAAPALNVGVSSEDLGEGVTSPENLADQLRKMW